jgi:putative methionine-R-sulfoxide reductase with GAF domain
MSAVPEFAERLARVLTLVSMQRTLPAQLEAVVALAKRTVPNCDAAGVTLVVSGEPLTGAATDTVALEVDVVQYETGQGPCLDAIAGSNVVRVDLIDGDLRYERFAPGAVDTAINSVVSFPLVAAGRTAGALNLYSYLPDAFDADTERVMAPIVSYAADVLSTSPLYACSLDMVEGLMESLEERAVIDQATGALMARNGWTAAASFDFLRDRALVRSEPLREAARAILALDLTAGPAPSDLIDDPKLDRLHPHDRS